MNKLSHSSVRMYSECSRKWFLHYKKRLRSKTIGGALLFGSAVDNGLNALLKTRNLEEGIKVFEKSWNFQYINDALIALSKSTVVVYADKDFDKELLNKEDHQHFKEFQEKLNLFPFKDLGECMDELKDKKSNNGFVSLTDEEKQLMSYGSWLSMKRKGYLMLRGYNDKILPQIEEVVEVQKKFEVKNKEGDTIVGVGDIILKFKDGKTYIMDNKTSTRQYLSDAGMRSPQLILYYHVFKKKYTLDGVGFIVLYKAMKKNREKTCKVCGYNKHTTHTKCNNLETGKRCNGELNEVINPECDVDLILNTVPAAAEQLVMESFDEANHGINQGVFRPNLLACGDTNSDYRCQFYNHCWNSKDDDLIELAEREKKLDTEPKT